MTVVRDSPSPTTPAERRSLGFVALIAAILAFSFGSTLVKLAHTAAITIAFWRMLVCTIVWVVIMRVADKRWLTWADLRAGAVPGVLFGLNITVFFIGVTHTSVAHAEFIGSMTPLVLVPAGALLFGEHLRVAALGWGLLSLAGLFLVLAFGPTNGQATWKGDLLIVAGTALWASYLLSTRRFRMGRTVSVVMASLTPSATMCIVVLVIASGNVPTLGEFSARSWVVIGLLAVLTGTMAHGSMVFAQHFVPIGTISLMQVAQPALAVVWSVVLLDGTVEAVQVAGMALVIAGLVAVSVLSRPTPTTLDSET